MRRRARFVALEFILRKMQAAMVNARFIFALAHDLVRRWVPTFREYARRNPALIAAEIKPRLGIRGGRGVQRKVFRVEEMFNAGHAAAPEPHPAKPDAGAEASAKNDLNRELALIQDTIARNKRELASLIGEGKERRMARASDELRAAVDGMDDATQKILKSVEIIDESARALTATLKDDYKRGLAQDIQDHVMQIYEACNFQDIAGQRISNVIGTMTMVEDRVSAVLGRCDSVNEKAPAKPAPGRGLLNGPKLEGDTGHASQRDIDELFR
jgi:chemotaxis protein CheZ